MELGEPRLREMTGRELLLSLSRLGAALSNPDDFRQQVRERGFETYYPDRDEEDDNEETYSDCEAMDLEEDLVGDTPFPSVAPRPSSCSYLYPGRSFSGQQRLSAHQRHQQEDWAVTATIYSCDFEQGRITGSMVAQNSPFAKRPIVTYFEGEIIDNVHHTFWTGAKWGARPSHESDLRHWARCPGFSGGLRAAALRHEGRAPQLGAWPHVFMRWKEVFFVDVPQDCPLTITGFYYLSLDRSSGAIGGYYHDSRAAPLQVLQLQPVECCGAAGAGSSRGRGSGEGSDSSSSDTAAGGGEAGAAAAGSGAGGEVCGGMAFGAYTLC